MIYYFSSTLGREAADHLKTMNGFVPINTLVSQLDRSSIKAMMRYQDEGIVNKLFIDSGAFSAHSGKATIDVDEYIEYLNSIDDRVGCFAQVDVMPGTHGKPKSPHDYEVSMNESWKNFLYMYPKMKSPEKLIPVFHYGEPSEHFKSMIEWKDENGVPLQYVGISPSAETTPSIVTKYIMTCFDIIQNSSNPNIHTHLFGVTSLPLLSKVNAYSADSISHQLGAAYGRVYHPKFGMIKITRQGNKGNPPFQEVCGAAEKQELQEYLNSLGTSIEECSEVHCWRSAVNIYGLSKFARDLGNERPKISKPKSLF